MKAKNIIVAIDFSESSEALLHLAISLARSNAAKLHIAYVKEPFGLYDGDCKAEDIPPFADLESLKKALAEVLPGDADVSHEQWLLTGDPAQSILRLAKQLRADLIVLGTHGRTGLRRLLMGSVAEAIIRHAHCPVAIVKQPVPEEAVTT